MLAPSSSSTLDRDSTCIDIGKSHAVDWVVTLVLAIIAASITLIQPYQQVFDAHDPRISFPLLASTVPDWAVPVIGLGLPAVILVCMFFYSRSYNPSFSGPKERRQLHRHLLGLCLANSLTFILTTGTKVFVGRPRPNFLAMTKYSNGTFHASISDINQAYSAFPSGHSSMTMCGMVFLFQILLGWFHRSPSQFQGNQAWRSVVCLIPWMIGLFVMSTRLIDYWHDYSDVLAGGSLGTAMSWYIYRYHSQSPPPLRKNSEDRTPNYQALSERAGADTKSPV